MNSLKSVLPPLSRRASWLALGLCVPMLTGCLEKQTLAKVPDAENQMFTSNGRYLVTGGEGIYELVKEGSALVSKRLALEVSGIDADNPCNFVGIAQIQNWIFTACQQRPNGLFGMPNNYLLAAKLSGQEALVFREVLHDGEDPLDQFVLPNGLAVTPNNKLLIADYNLLMSAAVARISLDLNLPTPKITRLEKNWLGGDYGIQHPNGVRVIGQELFVSDYNDVKRYQFDASGNVPLNLSINGRTVKNEVTVYQGGLTSVMDDIQPHCGGVIINSFLGGKLMYAAPDGVDANGLPRFKITLQSAAQSLQQPSSVAVGQPPLFNGYDLLVTEKGILGELTSDYGNRLSRLKSTVDLNDPLACEVINQG